MTEPQPSGADPGAALVADLVQHLVKALRAVQLYLPNNPIYRQSIDAVSAHMPAIWEETSDVELEITATGIRWEGHTVYEEPDKAESLAWSVFKDGVRWIRMRPGCEDGEMVRLLEVLNAARHLSSDADDDLLTLMWEADFELITYRFVEPGEGVPELGPEESTPPPAPMAVQDQVEEVLSDPEPQAVVDLGEFDASLYILDDHERDYLRRELEREYRQDVRANLLGILLDMFELHPQVSLRSELVGIIQELIPLFLGDGDYQSVSYLLREIRVVVARAEGLQGGHKKDLEGLPARLSKPEVFEQLLQSLDQAESQPTEEELGAFFSELQPEALMVAVSWLARLGNPQIRSLLDAAVQRLARAHPKAVAATLKAKDIDALLSAVRLVRWLRIATLAGELGALLEHENTTVRVETVAALGEIGTPRCLEVLELALTDSAREVRIGAVRVFGNRRDRRVLSRIEAFVNGREARNADMTERLAFFEAYGQIGGKAAMDRLAGVLLERGFFRREDPHVRASAAMGIARVGTPEARTVLEGAESVKDPVVRTAVRRALREMDRKR